MDSFEDYDADQPEFAVGYKERQNYNMLGTSLRCANLRVGAGKDEIRRNAFATSNDPYTIFACTVESIFKSILKENADGHVSGIDADFLDDMTTLSDHMEKVELKNPTAYILGYIAFTIDGELTLKSFNHVVNDILPLVSDKSVKPIDIVRYARLVSNLKT